MDILYRDILAKDIGKVCRFADKWVGKNFFSEQELIAYIELGKAQGHSASLLAMVDDQIVAIRISFAPGSWQKQFQSGLTPKLWSVDQSQVAYFKSLFVADKFQGHGIGQELSNRSIEALKSMGSKAIICHSWLESPGNSSQRYLVKMGFKGVKDHPKFWYPIDYDCIRCGNESRCVCTAKEMIKYL